MPRDHRDWIVWQKSMDLVIDVYQITKSFPQSELHGLGSQMQRCAISIPSNIAEGYRRMSKTDSLRFYRISFGSASELETQIEIASRLGYSSPEELKKAQNLLTEVLKLISSMIFKK